MDHEDAKVSSLLGKTMSAISRGAKDGDDVIRILTMDGGMYMMCHSQDCCEQVGIESIVGDLTDLIGEPLTLAEEATNEADSRKGDDSQTWTFYKFATRKGFVDIRWLGTSNGYYSERVDFVKIRGTFKEELEFVKLVHGGV